MPKVIMNEMLSTDNIYTMLRELVNNFAPIGHSLIFYHDTNNKIILKIGLNDSGYCVNLEDPSHVNMIGQFIKDRGSVLIYMPSNEYGNIYVHYSRRNEEYRLYYRVKVTNIDRFCLSFNLFCFYNKFGPYIPLINVNAHAVIGNLRYLIDILGLSSYRHRLLPINDFVILYENENNVKILMIKQHGRSEQTINEHRYITINITNLQHTPIYERFVRELSEFIASRYCPIQTYVME